MARDAKFTGFQKHDDSRILLGKTKLWKKLHVFLQTVSRSQLSLSVGRGRLWSHKPHVSLQIPNPDFGKNAHGFRTATVC